MITQIDKLISFTQQLLRIDSRSGHEGELAAALSYQMSYLGYDEVWSDRLGNVIGRIKGRGSGPVLLLEGHMDTVALSSNAASMHDSYGGIVQDGRLYGLGASDMKAGLAAIVYGAAQLKRAGILPNGDIYVAGTVGKHMLEGAGLKMVMNTVKPDYVIIGEPTGLDLNIGQRGLAELKVSFSGERSRCCHSDNEVNAITDMLSFLDQVSALTPPENHHLGKGISVITDICSAPYPGKKRSANQCIVTINRWLLPKEDVTTILNQLRNLDPNLSITIAEHSWKSYTGAEITGRSYYPAWLMDVDHQFIQQSLKALHQQGIPAKISTYKGCTNGSYSAGIAGVPTIGFGPSYEHRAYLAEDYIEIEQLIKSAEGYFAITKNFTITPRSDTNV